MIKKNFNIDFMQFKNVAFSLTAILIIASLVSLFNRGLNYGIDFTGGLLLEVKFEDAPDLSVLRAEFAGDEQLGEVSIQNFGSDTEVIIRAQIETSKEQSAKTELMKKHLNNLNQQYEIRRVDFVGPTVGGEMIEGSIIAVTIAVMAIMIYIWVRFEWQFSAGAVIALVHDAILLLGFFSITGTEFGLSAIAAILTILGYSINDSVVIYDRVRENLRRYKKKLMKEILNLSINENLARTILTSVTTMLAGTALVVFGGEIIRGLSTALLFGVAVGTYSSIFVAGPVLIYFGVRDGQKSEDANS